MNSEIDEKDDGECGRARREMAALRIIHALRARGFEAVYAGGYVRDMIMGIAADRSDIDIATNATPESIAGVFSHVVPVGEQFGVMLVIEEGIAFEVATFRSDVGIADGRRPARVVYTDAATDALRRDFTINGLFYDPVSRDIIDYVDGRRDIEAGIIRAIGDPRTRFREDYLRLLRGIRFAARFGFEIEPCTWEAIAACREGLGKVSPERIFQEIDKMLTGPHPDRAVALMHDAGLTALVLPEIDTLAGVEQPPEFHPEGDVFVHTLRALSMMNAASRVCAWSVLLHDIGKPATRTVSDRIRFNNHHVAGAAIAREILKRLRAPAALAEAVTACVENHMNFMNVRNMRLSTLKRFLSRETFWDEMELHRVDCLASHGDLSNYEFLKERAAQFRTEQIRPAPLLGGRDLIALGLAPGPLFGRVLERLYDLQLEEVITTRDQALQWVKRHVVPDPAAWDNPRENASAPAGSGLQRAE